MSLLPQSEVIEQALRKQRTVYPEIALHEIVRLFYARLSLESHEKDPNLVKIDARLR